MISNPQVLTEVMGYDPDDLEYEKVINSIHTTDQDYGVDVIFDYSLFIFETTLLLYPTLFF